MEFGDFLKMQHDLAVEKGWIWDRTPENGPFSLLWSMDELGEAISIIKKKGSYGIMENPAVREHFVEEVADHLMYIFDMMECYSITAEEFTDIYVKKYERNMGRSWSENRAVNDAKKVTVTDKAPADDGAFVVCSAETLEKLRALFGEDEA